jgi:hypothetical protein
MELRRGAKIIACVIAVAAYSTAAQAQWTQQQSAPQAWPQGQQPQPQQPAQTAWPQQPQPLPQQGGAAPWAAPSQPQPQQAGPSPWNAPQQGPPPCIQAFLKMRDDAQKKAELIHAASERHASPQEACALFTAFSAAEVKLIKYAVDNAASCGIPPEVPANLKKGHARTTDLRTKICQAASRPMPQAAPSLSDALTSPVPDSKNIKSGGGTFDTLSGTPLGR